MTLAKAFVDSGFFTDAKSQAQAIVKILAGQEMGFGPMASMTGVYIVKGKVSLSANLMAAALKRSGRYNYRVQALTDRECVVEFYERTDGGWESIGQSAFSFDDAKKANLTSNPTWKQYPRNMLFARALSNGVRWYCPDIFGGPLYTPEELGAPVNADGEPVVIVENSPEIVSAASEPMITKAQLKALHAYGKQLYGPEWDAKRHEILNAKGLSSSKDLTRDQATAFIDWLVKKIDERAAAQAAAQIDDTEPDAMDADAALAEVRAA